MQSLINEKIKFRESFRPFAPVVMEEFAQQYFDLAHESPYMMFVAPVRKKLELPAVTHVNGSARLQTVDQARQPLLHQLLESFRQRTGCAAMVNTSFNIRGEPIVCTPQDAIQCFLKTNMDALVLGRHIVRKDLQENWKALPPDVTLEKQTMERDLSPSSSLVRPNWSPNLPQLRWFGWLAMGVVLFLAWRFSSQPLLSRLLIGTGLALAGVGSFLPQMLRPVYVALMLVLLPIGWIVSEILLLAFYFGLVVPTALLFWMMGRDELRLKRPTAGNWQERTQAEPSRYYRQF